MSQGRYDHEFYLAQRAGSRASAEVILPIVINEVGPLRTVIDIGGGVGPWSRVAMDLGIQHIVLVDGDWILDQDLEVPVSMTVQRDLEESISGLGRFDLVICLEVAEHLPANRASSLVADLCLMSDHVLFSAAVPGQGGQNHVNEQWLSYWQRLFASEGFSLLDPIRTQVWTDPRVDWWYAQNTVLFVKGGPRKVGALVDIVHPRAISGAIEQARNETEQAQSVAASALADITHLRTELVRAVEEANRAREKVVQAQAENTEIRMSRSWRWTRPLRLLSQKFR